jgi:hypothetical protein
MPSPDGRTRASRAGLRLGPVPLPRKLRHGASAPIVVCSRGDLPLTMSEEFGWPGPYVATPRAGTVFGRRSASTSTLRSGDLVQAISLYLQTVADLPPEERPFLLRRPVPFLVRLKFLAKTARGLFCDNDGGRQYSQFTLRMSA